MIYRFKSLIRKTLLGEDVYFCIIINGEGKFPSPIIQNCSWGYGKLTDEDVILDEKMIDVEDNTIHINENTGDLTANTQVISDFNQEEVDWVEYYFQDVLNMTDYFKLIKVDE